MRMSNINPDLNTLFLTGEKPMSKILILGLSKSQIQGQWTKEMVQSSYELGKDFPENLAKRFVVYSSS